MPKLILKSPYIKCGGKGGGGGGYLRYIGTRDGVELVPDDRPATKRQERLIRSLVRDFPDSKELLEYADWEETHTKVHASAFITMALECNWEQTNRSDVYLKYIATRPTVERLGSHGLFGDSDSVDLQQAAAELDSYTGNVWTHIISLKREDAARLGYDHASAWRDLLRQERNEIAAAMSIPPDHFRWYAAFHDEGDHPHVHMTAWSSHPTEGGLDRNGIRKIKSTLTNQIFQQEMLHLYEQKTVSRDELVREARASMLVLVREMRRGICDHPEAKQLMCELAQALDGVKGQKKYGYLPKPVKKLVDKIVDEMERLPAVAKCYEQWQTLQGEVEGYYSDAPPRRQKLSERKEFRQIKNAVVAEAETLRLSALTFEGAQQPDEDTGYDHSRNEWYWKMKRILDDPEEPMESKDWAVSEMQELADYGVSQAWYVLGTLYRDGGILIPDSALAAEAFEKAALAVIRLLHSMSRVFQDNSLPKHSPVGMRTESKLLQKIREKKIAMGHKPDDHPDEGMTMGW